MASLRSLGLLFTLGFALILVTACGGLASPASGENSVQSAPGEPESTRNMGVVQTTDLRQGDCIRGFGEPIHGMDVETVEVVECEDVRSKFEVTGLSEQPDGPYPGSEPLLRRIGSTCGTDLSRFVTKYAFVPSEEEWVEEDWRYIICMKETPSLRIRRQNAG